MTTTRAVQHCRWSECTLFQPMPFWLDAWERPWSCRVEGRVRVLADTDDCLRCSHWTPRDEVATRRANEPR